MNIDLGMNVITAKFEAQSNVVMTAEEFFYSQKLGASATETAYLNDVAENICETIEEIEAEDEKTYTDNIAVNICSILEELKAENQIAIQAQQYSGGMA